MAIDERARHDLYVGLEELMGRDRADALMGLLPPVGWADVATKHDLAALEERIDLRFDVLEERLESRFERIDSRFERLEERLEERMDSRFEGVEHRFESLELTFRSELHAELRAQMRTLFFGLLTALLTMASICIAAIALAR